MDSINEYVKVPCGFAALKDIRTMIKEDQMESFVLSETFKYLYMIFTEPEELLFDPDHYVLTTEAHFLPLSMGEHTEKRENPRRMILRSDEPKQKNYVCANPIDFTKLPTEREEAQLIRERTKILLGEFRSGPTVVGTSMNCESPWVHVVGLQSSEYWFRAERIRAWAFSASNQEHIKQLAQMGIQIVTHDDGRLHLSHQSINVSFSSSTCWSFEFQKSHSNNW